MEMILNLPRRVLWILQWFLVVIFIVFEELIWEGIAKPVYSYIHQLHLLQSLQKKLEKVNRYVLLAVFLVLLVSVEGAGVAAGVMALKGMVLAAGILYALKIPIAAFVFWLFHATEPKLLSFGWFRWLYEKILAFFAWMKSLKIYQDAMAMLQNAKDGIKIFKAKYFRGENTVSKRFRRLYKATKRAIGKMKNSGS
jgi:hypothetical protein